MEKIIDSKYIDSTLSENESSNLNEDKEIKKQTEIINMIEEMIEKLKEKIKDGFVYRKKSYVIVSSICALIAILIPFTYQSMIYFDLKTTILFDLILAAVDAVVSFSLYVMYLADKNKYEMNRSNYEYLTKEYEKETEKLEKLYEKKKEKEVVKTEDNSEANYLCVSKKSLKDIKEDLEKKASLYYDSLSRMNNLLMLHEHRKLKEELLKIYDVEDASFVEEIVEEESRKRLAFLNDEISTQEN